MMQMKPEELRQLRSWAITTVLAKHQVEQASCEDHHTIDIKGVIAEARQLVNFVRANP